MFYGKLTQYISSVLAQSEREPWIQEGCDYIYIYIKPGGIKADIAMQ